MNNIDSILLQINEVVKNPGLQVKKYKAVTGKKVVGCLPIYVPEEIIHAAGMLPIGLWGGKATIAQSHTYLQSFACSIMQAIMEMALQGVYDGLAAVIVPAHCDTLKCIGENWKVAKPEIRCIGLVYPQNRKIEAGVQFLRAEMAHVKEELEAICGQSISDQAIQHSIEVYNDHRRTMMEFLRLAVDYPSVITPGIRHQVVKAGYFMRKEEHTRLVQELMTELKQSEKEREAGLNIIITGIMTEPDEFLKLLEQYHMNIAADDLAHESRQFRTLTPEGADPLERLARRWSDLKGCSLTYDPAKERGQMLIDMVRETGADGVVVSMMKFCEPEEFDYPIYKKELEAAGIPLLYLELDQQMQSFGQMETRLQGFTEILNSKN